ncbi:hypothetical protein BDV95DRAFT_219156 [Massariosphaeria phaeospora]|uniref:Uncharacterized protein n=1 Tax=Massariosphaeria phaeospora TaxID=100035 RepID=A0A7C8MGC5_9PLEO|nr:hypothetical protein BDV95DRAFT_219156 [Massariosphaeria phaeospora]
MGLYSCNSAEKGASICPAFHSSISHSDVHNSLISRYIFQLAITRAHIRPSLSIFLLDWTELRTGCSCTTHFSHRLCAFATVAAYQDWTLTRGRSWRASYTSELSQNPGGSSVFFQSHSQYPWLLIFLSAFSKLYVKDHKSIQSAYYFSLDIALWWVKRLLFSPRGTDGHFLQCLSFLFTTFTT